MTSLCCFGVFFCLTNETKPTLGAHLPTSTDTKLEPADLAAPCTYTVNSDRLAVQTPGQQVNFHQICFPPKGLCSDEEFGAGIRNTVLAEAEAHTATLCTREVTY